MLLKLEKDQRSLIKKFPSMVTQINNLMQLKRPRERPTRLFYIWGKAGVGKTTMVTKVLNAIQRLEPRLSHYQKMGGMNKYFDGYNNNPIVWLDDPIKPGTDVASLQAKAEPLPVEDEPDPRAEDPICFFPK